MSQEQTFRFAKHDKVQAMANVDASMGGNMCFRKEKKKKNHDSYKYFKIVSQSQIYDHNTYITIT